jgi:tripartite-type tricarboxylate transporter receptor subunit TctC
MIRSRLAAALLFASAILAAANAVAQYPTRPIKWIVPYPPGGITDSATRMITQKLEAALGQPIVIENKPGANSIVGAELAARSAPDGYTFVTVIGGHAANATLYAGKLPFDPVKSFAPVSLVGIAPLIVVCNNDFPAKDMKDLIAYAKANPGKINMASGGSGSPTRVAGELFKMMAGVDMVHVPYRGEGLALPDLISGQVQVLFGVMPASLGYIRAGKLRALAVTTAKRQEPLPDVPTVGEFLPGYEARGWYGVVVPKATPTEIVKKLNKEINAALADPNMKKRLTDLGAAVFAGSPADFEKFIADEIEKWAKVVKFAGIKPD